MEEFTVITGGIEGWKSKKTRTPKEAFEGVDATRTNIDVAPNRFPREGYLGKPPGAVSLTKISVSDLISEGRISGLVAGFYTYDDGTAGKTGWDTVTWTEYPNAPNTSIPWLRSIYWNQVPVVNPNNQFNFSSVDLKFTPGAPNGSTADQITTEATTVRSVGERLRYGADFAKIYRVLNKNIKAIDVNVRFNQLSKSETSKKRSGDVVETEVKYNISYRPLFSDRSMDTVKYITPPEGQETVRGKVSFGYIRKSRINLYQASENFSAEPDFLGWEIKVERMTPDSTTSYIRNQTFLDSIVEVYGDVFSYPNSALVHSRFSAEYFSQVPVRHYEVRGLRVMIPNNYDPIKRTYSPNIGNDWDGGFKVDGNGEIVKEWTDNPAWCYFDLLTNRNYGLGKYITGNDISVDKWTIYDIGRYCDVLVSDGYGGLEPRFSCNVVINTREEAFKVVNDMASIFRGMAYYGAGTVFTVQDSPKNSYTVFTNANVEEGGFVYSTSSKRVRHTVAVVRYNDKKNYYKPTLEYVEDVDGIRRYGIRELELIGFGCTSRGQAVRLGRWALLTETSETETVTFTAGLEGSLVRPGDVVSISDRNRRGTRYGGRTYQIHNASTITLDSELPSLTSDNLYYFRLVTPTWNYDPLLTSSLLASDISGIRKSHIQVQTFRGNQAESLLGSDDVWRTKITFSDPFDSANHSLSGQLIWAVDSSGVNDIAYDITDQYRVVNIQEKEPHKYSIYAIEYNKNKYNQIESGLNFGTQTQIDTAPAGPSNLTLDLKALSQGNNPNQEGNAKKIEYRFNIALDDSVSKYLVYVKAGSDFSATDTNSNTYLVNVLPPTKRDGIYIPLDNTRYYFRVYSATSNNTKSTDYASNDIIVNGVDPIKDIIIQSLRLDAEEDQDEPTTDTTTEVNDPGSRQTDTFLSANPSFLWQVGFLSNTIINFNLTGLGYRVTIREPSDTNTPSKKIYWEPDVQLTGKFDNLAYTFTFDENKVLDGGPFRKFDVVVEAVDTHTKTSAAGGKYENPPGTPKDTEFTNSYSYDILGVNNPPIDDFKLTDAPKNVVSRYNTEQWISTNGEIKLWVKDKIPPDWEGGFAYVWTGISPFTREEAYKKFDATFPGDITTDKNIIKLPFAGSGEAGLITIPTGITGHLSAYMAVSPADSFDLARYEDGTLKDTHLTMSNVTKIYKRLGFNDKLLPHAWIETDVNYTTQNINTDWTNYAVGIKEIVCESYNDTRDNNATRFKWNFGFDKALPNTNYIVIAPDSGEKVQPGASIVKSVDKFQAIRFSGKQFFAVYYNGNETA